MLILILLLLFTKLTLLIVELFIVRPVKFLLLLLFTAGLLMVALLLLFPLLPWLALLLCAPLPILFALPELKLLFMAPPLDMEFTKNRCHSLWTSPNAGGNRIARIAAASAPYQCSGSAGGAA